MDEGAGHMEIHVMDRHQGFRSGHFCQGREYETRRPAGGSEWLLIVTVDGAGVHRNGEDTTLLSHGTALLYAPGVPQHYATAGRPGHWELVWAHFEDDPRLRAHTGWPQRSGGAGVLQLGAAAPKVTGAMREVVDWHRTGSLHRYDFAANALERALIWCETVNPCNPRSGMDNRVEQALELISAHLSRPLSVADVAREVGVSPSRLSHLFKKEVGVSFPGYLENRRMERAEDLLRMTDRSVGEIARSVGYDDPLYFSRRFRRRTGASPSEWRGTNP
jgi:AraC family transcriptional regulator of arabinose operon